MQRLRVVEESVPGVGRISQTTTTNSARLYHSYRPQIPSLVSPNSKVSQGSGGSAVENGCDTGCMRLSATNKMRSSVTR